jgi:hypothetical protein
MSDIVERLREHATDWNGEQMPDLEPAKGDPTAGMLRHAGDVIESLRAENARPTEERDALVEGLRWYAQPHIYAPHPNGPAFDDRDLSWHARSVLAKVKREGGNLQKTQNAHGGPDAR